MFAADKYKITQKPQLPYVLHVTLNTFVKYCFDSSIS